MQSKKRRLWERESLKKQRRVHCSSLTDYPQLQVGGVLYSTSSSTFGRRHCLSVCLSSSLLPKGHNENNAPAHHNDGIHNTTTIYALKELTTSGEREDKEGSVVLGLLHKAREDSGQRERNERTGSGVHIVQMRRGNRTAQVRRHKTRG